MAYKKKSKSITDDSFEEEEDTESKGNEATTQSILADIKKTFKKTNPDIISEPGKAVEFIPSGNFIYDMVTNCRFGGGFPRRRITEIFGPEHCGKSSIIYSACAGVQRKKGLSILFDFENGWESYYAKTTFGLEEDGETFIVFQPDTAEEGDVILDKLWDLPNIDIVAIDSIDAMRPKALIECALSDTPRIGLHAATVGRMVVKFRRFARIKNAALILANQMRSKIDTNPRNKSGSGQGFGFQYDDNETTTGGNTLRYYASVRMKLDYGGQQLDEFGTNLFSGESEKALIGQIIKVMNVKNKVGTPRQKYNTHFDFPRGAIKGGWNEGRDVMSILKKQGRLRQTRGKLTYLGLAIPEWAATGSKPKCEEEFINNSEAVEDGKKLIYKLISENGGSILEEVNSNDFTEDEIKGQDTPPEKDHTRIDKRGKVLDVSKLMNKEDDEDISL